MLTSSDLLSECIDDVVSAIALRAAYLPKDIPKNLSDVAPSLHLYSDGKIDIYYAPLGFINTRAVVTIVGLTPGWRQMQIAYRGAIAAIAEGKDPIFVHKQHNPAIAFAGVMRRNLIVMLDDLYLNRFLGIDSCSDLFESDMLHTTSLLRYPVFKNGRNYSGTSPAPIKHLAMYQLMKGVLVPELNQVSSTLIIPLGRAVETSLEYLTTQGFLDSHMWLRGFPHPSGANGHRVALFEKRKEGMREQIMRWFHSRSAAK